MISIITLLGLTLGGFIGYKIHNKILMKKLDGDIIPKRGLYKNSYSFKEKPFDMEVEYTVIDESADMVKIEVNLDTIKSSTGSLNNQYGRESLKELADGWYNRDATELKEFKRTKQEVRREKLKELLDE